MLDLRYAAGFFDGEAKYKDTRKALYAEWDKKAMSEWKPVEAACGLSA